MPLRARTRAREMRIGGHGTLMARCLIEGLPVASACSGRGACAKCVVMVLKGAEALSPMEEHEREVLRRNGAVPGVRLSCQAKLVDPLAEVLIHTGYW